MSSMSRPSYKPDTLRSARAFGTLPPVCPDDDGDTLPPVARRAARPLRVYVAAAQEDYTRARAAMALLQRLGIEITHDWTIEVEAHRAKPVTADELAHYAKLDADAVQQSDVVLVLTPETKDRGCGVWAELGMAVAYGRRLVVTGPQRARCIFSVFSHRYESDAEGIAAIMTGDV